MRFHFDELPVIDNHCHPFPTGRVPKVIENTWTISLNPLTPQEIRAGAYFQMSTAEMCRYHGVTDVDKMLLLREELYRRDPRAYTQKLWADANIQMLLADIGSPVTNKRLTPEELAEFAALNDSIEVRYINRIERVTDDLLPLGLSFSEFERRFLADTRRMAAEQHLIALKSIIAYRTGLEVLPAPRAEVERQYEAYLRDNADKRAEKYIRDYVFLLSGELCRELNIPLQIHTGAGDSPLSDLRLNNPLLLYDALNDPRMRNVSVMLVHAGNPNTEYAAYLAAHYPNVYLDVSSMCPYFAHTVEDKLRAILGFAPFNKVMYGSDGGGIPDHHWFSAKYFKRALARVMDRFVEDGILGVSFAEEAARWILSENASAFYRL